MSQEFLTKKRKSRSVSSFLKKTYQMLQNQGNHYAVRWANDGIGFVVIKQEEFSKQILPLYFKHSNYSSFVRQLNMYNFHKLREAGYESHFHHDCFRRDNREMLAEIKRKPQKKKKKYDDQESQDDSKSNISVKKHLQNRKIYNNGSNIEIKIKSWREEQKKGMQNTRHAFVSEKQQQIDQSRSRVSIQNILSAQNEDDKISINNELGQRFPRYPTKEIFYPSSNNIYPFPMKGAIISHYNLFF